MARLGERAVYGLAQVDEHRPERQYRCVPPVLIDAGTDAHAKGVAGDAADSIRRAVTRGPWA